ncbi:MAG: hypothetical protein ACRDC4_12250 [Plesiomonas sp.]
MSYGVQIWNDAGVELIQGSQNIFAVGIITNPQASGSQAYHLGSGETLVAIPQVSHGTGTGKYLTGVSVSGNVVNWTVDSAVNTDGVFYVVVYKTGVG